MTRRRASSSRLIGVVAKRRDPGNCARRSIWQLCGPLRDSRHRAQALLQPIVEAFVEGLDTADLKAAEHLLTTLR